MLRMRTKRLMLASTASLVIATGQLSYAADEADDLGEFDEIIVTGTTAKGRTKLESSVAITTADFETLSREMPFGTADALELVPGFWVEDSGGEVSNNVAPRGLGGGAAFRFISMQEDGLPIIYDGDQTDSFLRQDVTIERLEAIRGGTSGVLTVNGAASIVNFITKKGTENPEGIVRLTISDYGTFRGEAFYGGPLNDDWLIGIGGYYRSSDGIRDTGFVADHGGQFRVNLTRKLENGKLTFSYKHVDENNSFFLPIPLTNPDNISEFPGFDANFGTMLSLDNSRMTHRTPNGTQETNLRDGFATNGDAIGVRFDWDVSDNISVSSNNRYTKINMDINAVFSRGDGSLKPGRDRLQDADAQALVAQFSGQGAVGAAFKYTGTGEIITDIDSLNGNGFVVDQLALFRERDIEQFMSDNRVNYTTEDNTLTVGVLFTHHSLVADKQLGSPFLSEVANNPNRLDLIAIDASGNEVASLTDDSFLHFGSWSHDRQASMQSASFYANDEYQVTDDLRIDGGIRFETLSYDLTEQLQAEQALPGADPLVLASQTGNFGTGNFVNGTASYNEVAWTIGASYTVSENLAVYARYADAFQTPGINSISTAQSGVVGLTFGEIGLRYQSEIVNVSLTAFRTKFNDLSFTVTRDSGDERITVGTKATGLEFEIEVTPHEMFSIAAMGVIQDTSITDIPQDTPQFDLFDGNSVQRTPNTQFRITPTVHLDFADIFAVYHYFGQRYADLGNTIPFGSYSTIDAGAVFYLTDNLSLQVKGTNLTNSIGLTEGNPRAGFTENDGTGNFFARPIFGRSFKAALSYNF